MEVGEGFATGLVVIFSILSAINLIALLILVGCWFNPPHSYEADTYSRNVDKGVNVEAYRRIKWALPRAAGLQFAWLACLFLSAARLDALTG